MILPPKKELPAPGPRQPVTSPESWPQDPDVLRKQAALEEKKKQKVDCGEYDFKRKSTSQVEDDFEEIIDPLQRCQGFIGRKLKVGDEARGDGSPDELIEGHDDLTTKKELPSPWLSETSQARPSTN